ncbi:MAG TPA: hypothetical protein VLF69_01930 [Candidatus Saccharimonadales bacterium]|nr:hypothetical protein [Candidatus Saccharimonadales bacterium]
MGLVGADVTEEQAVMGLMGEAVAGLNGLRFVLAGRPGGRQRYWEKVRGLIRRPVVGTSYPTITKQLLGFVDIKYMEGSIEAMPDMYPEVEAICDVARTGETIRQNGLEIWQDLAPVQLMLVRQAESDTI